MDNYLIWKVLCLFIATILLSITVGEVGELYVTLPSSTFTVSRGFLLTLPSAFLEKIQMKFARVPGSLSVCLHVLTPQYSGYKLA